MNLRDKLEILSEQLIDSNNEILILAEEENDPELFENVVKAMVSASYLIKNAYNKISSKEEAVTPKMLDELVEFATALDMSGDESLQKKAAVIDQLLLNLGVAKQYDQVFKEAQEEEISKLRKEYREKSLDPAYKFPKEELDRDILAAEAAEAIKKSIKEYRPLETALSTRYCPDHPGTSVMRVTDEVYQCPLDKKIYNYREGFETMRHNVVPGTSVQNQTQALTDRQLEETHFSTRESKLNNQ
jgi:hypothetical protein